MFFCQIYQKCKGLVYVFFFVKITKKVKGLVHVFLTNKKGKGLVHAFFNTIIKKIKENSPFFFGQNYSKGVGSCI